MQYLSFGLQERSKAHVINKAGIVLFVSKEEGQFYGIGYHIKEYFIILWLTSNCSNTDYFIYMLLYKSHLLLLFTPFLPIFFPVSCFSIIMCYTWQPAHQVMKDQRCMFYFSLSLQSIQHRVPQEIINNVASLLPKYQLKSIACRCLVAKSRPTLL